MLFVVDYKPYCRVEDAYESTHQQQYPQNHPR